MWRTRTFQLLLNRLLGGKRVNEVVLIMSPRVEMAVFVESILGTLLCLHFDGMNVLFHFLLPIRGLPEGIGLGLLLMYVTCHRWIGMYAQNICV